MTLHIKGHILDEKYRIERQLGKGGMGAVYLATHIGTDRPVALKVIAPQFMMNDEFVERFRREAKAAGRLHHPNVVNVTDFGFAAVDGRKVAYLVMEYLDGCTLADILEEETSLPIGWTVDIIEQTCYALDEAHRHGVVHRDLKPDNLWLEPNRRGGYRVKVLDFGLAKLDAPLVAEGDETSTSRRDSDAVGSGQKSVTTGTMTGPSPTNRQDKSPAEQSKEDDAATRILAPEADKRETRVVPAGRDAKTAAAAALAPTDSAGEPSDSTSLAEDRTRIIQRETVRDSGSGSSSDSTDGLTRVGSVLGTPVYMSPEQCQAMPLDARSDIYSLAVITYQMLAGEPPFRGTMAELMKQHIEVPPPPLARKRKKIPRRMAGLVMLGLAKNPYDRPASAAGFASALRAYSEGSGTLLRRALSMYSEYFPKFVRLSIVVYSASALVSLIQFFLARNLFGSADSVRGQIWRAIFGLSNFLLNFVASSIVVAVTIRLVTQLNLAPLKPLRVRSAFRSVKPRLWPLLKITMLIGCLSILLLGPGIVPGAIFYINSALTAPVVIMEKLQGFAARRRSKLLVRRVRKTVIATIIIQYLIPAMFSLVFVLAVRNFLKHVDESSKERLLIAMGPIISVALNVFLAPLIAVLSALLYLKARQAGGETLREALGEFEEEDIPKTRWQRRMRERLTLPTQTGR